MHSLSDLNPPQREAVEHHRGPILILAGAGSGKTRVLTRRIAHLVIEHGVRPQSILAVTFTNKATEEMRERLQQIMGERAQSLWVATFHSASLRILRRHANLLSYTNDFAVYDEDDSRALIKQLVKEMGIDEKRYPPQLFARAMDQAKNAFVLPQQYAAGAKDYQASLIAELYAKYQTALLKANAMDFGDLLVNALLLLEREPRILEGYRSMLEYLLVDEFQDTNKVQYRFIRLMAEPRKNLLVVGDDDQSIYSFRGANISNILEFEKDFPGAKVVKLEQNYRSTGTVLRAAHAVIVKNSQRKAKQLWTSAANGAPIEAFVAEDEVDEARWIAQRIAKEQLQGTPLSGVAIFYRTNAQSRAIEEALIHSGIQYRIYGGLKFYERKEIKDIIAYLRLIMNTSDDQAFLRSVNTPPRGIGAQTVSNIASAASAQGTSMFEAAREMVDRNKGLGKFVGMIEELRELAKRAFLGELVMEIIERSEYAAKLKALKDVTSESRLENLQELVALARAQSLESTDPVASLRDFLDRVALTSGGELPVEENEDKTKHRKPDAVSLMTLHLAKGLEFPCVFLGGLEEGLLPHNRSLEDPAMVEEERRLCYVGITRAMQRLYVSRAERRGMFASGGDSFAGFREPSRFIMDIPSDCFSRESGDFLSRKPPTLRDIHFEEIEEDLSGIVYPWEKKKERKKPSLGLLASADSLLKSADDLGASVKTALPTDLAPGLAIRHPAFGRGIIETVEGDVAGDARDLKVSIKFDNFEGAKKLVFKYAKLVLEQAGG